ncbi:hypothetical protein Tsubulata_043914 [Turnera subulata]|uniref:Uncharacterized protein n=1 Tax=Turnera subulata TaxID=218843 RepID=A0A9Q0F353_9ROSI|nr:hypothetical protein Tsubulata_043914 [Turnera subulata]
MEECIRNSRGVQLFTCRWLPPSSTSPKALVFLCHVVACDCGFVGLSYLLTSLNGVGRLSEKV